MKAALAGDQAAVDEALPSLKAASLPWLRTFLSLDPATYWKRVKVPVLAMNGALDVQVDVANLKAIERALRSGGNKQMTVVEMPGLNHLFQHAKTGAVREYASIEETCAPEALAKIRDFVAQQGK